MKKVSYLTRLAFTLCCLLAAPAARPQEVKAPDAPALALRIAQAGSPHAGFDPVPEAGVTKWYGQFERLPDWKEPEGKHPILAVRFAYRMRGGRAQVRVTVHRGVKFYDSEEFVAEYDAAAGDSFVVKELEQFGVRPFELSVVKRVDAGPARPVAVRLRTRSLEAAGVEFDRKSARARILLRNLSREAVVALKLEAWLGEARGAVMWPLGREGRPIIEAGGVGEVLMSLGHGALKRGEAYEPVNADAVVVTSALFADGSYEGELRPAAHAAAQYAGYRVQLGRVLELARRTLESGEADAPGAAARFKERVVALGREAEPHVVAEVFNSFPGLAEGDREQVKGQAEAAMDWLDRDVFAGLAAFEARADGATFRAWLEGCEKRLGEWLARLRR